MKKLKFYIKALIIVMITITMISCKSSKTMKGGAIGAATGGVIGGIIGERSGNTAQGAILGAMIGGSAGALIGNYMDKQAEELQKDLENATVERIGEGIKITFDSGILFDFNSSDLRTVSQENIVDLAETLRKYDDTEVLIEGHTDSIGSEEYNMTLSEERAGVVAEFLKQNDVAAKRIIVNGYGETQPVADNSTDDGRQDNRRVEIAIYANNKLKRAAEKGKI